VSIKAKTQVYQLNNFKREMTQLINDSSGLKSAQASLGEYSTEEYGDFSKILPIIQHNLEFSEQMTADLTAAGMCFKDILTPSCLCDYENILQAKHLVNNFICVLDEWERKYKNVLLLTEDNLKEVFSGDESSKKAMLESFEKNESVSNKLMPECFLFIREFARCN
jgi:hypothetical protein